jgi:hypothetical protein
MPDRVIKRVNTVGLAQGQGRVLAFANRNKESFDWADEVPEDDSEFQGLLDSAAPFPDISAEIPGVELASEMPVTAVEDTPEPDKEDRADAARANADINPAAFQPQPATIAAEPNEIVINVELPEDIGGVYPAAAAANPFIQNDADADVLQIIPDAAAVPIAPEQAAPEPEPQPSSEIHSSDEDSDFDPEEGSSDEEDAPLPSARVRQQALETLRKAKEARASREEPDQTASREIKPRSNHEVRRPPHGSSDQRSADQ